MNDNSMQSRASSVNRQSSIVNPQASSARRQPSFAIRYLLFALALLALGLGGWLIARSRTSESTLAPEARQVLDIQGGLPFQILIPAYLPKAFDRAAVEIEVSTTGPGDQPMVQLVYRTKQGAPLFIREWLPPSPGAESLAGSQPVYTKWGTGWLLQQGEGLIAIWVDSGLLRASIFAPDQEVVSSETLLAIADTMGPASNRQVFTALTQRPEVRAVVPPPFEIAANAEGIQEVDLIVSSSGYSPAHFAVKKGLPVRITFRQLGWVGCGNVISFPTGPDEYVELTLETPTDKKVIEFTPQVAGEFRFSCTHMAYVGTITVRE
jgi:hypothetical protein